MGRKSLQGCVEAVTLGEAVELSLRSPVPIVEQTNKNDNHAALIPDTRARDLV